MMRSLYSGVAGLRTHQTKMDVIGNNIANVNTTSYKSMNITFSELMYQTTQAASGASATGKAGTNARQIGLGVQSGAISATVTSAGASQTTGNPFDLRITGDAFFVVSDGSSTFFTRDGSFYVDGQGTLAMASNGYTVQGWQVDKTTGNIIPDTVSPLRIMSAENMTYPPEATTQANVTGVLDRNDAAVSSEAGKIISIGFYDNLGYGYTAKLSMKATGQKGQYTVELTDVLDSNSNSVMKGADDEDIVKFGSFTTVEQPKTLSLATSIYTLVPQTGAAVTGFTYTDPNDNTNRITINFEDLSASNSNNTANNMTEDDVKQVIANAYGYKSYEEFSKLYRNDDGGNRVTFAELVDNNGLATLITPPSVENDTETNTTTVTNPGGNLSADGRTLTGAIIQYDTSEGVIQTINGQSTDLTLLLDFVDDPASPFRDITVDFSESSNYYNNKTSTIGGMYGDLNGKGTGRKLGRMTGVSIQDDGMIYAAYDNGMTKLLGQIAVARFPNASGLQKEGDNLYSSTLNSGEFDGIGVDITSDGGYMRSGVLEMSNVDLSAEFTDMITTQRGFQANSRIITVSDTLLEELVNLKR